MRFGYIVRALLLSAWQERVPGGRASRLPLGIRARLHARAFDMALEPAID